MKVLCVCGSPRRGNSEAIAKSFGELFKKAKLESEVVLLREKKIGRCDGCVEYCNKNLDCHKSDDMPHLFEKIKKADGLVFVVPNYFKMPPGIFKDFMDRCCVFYTAKADFSKKRAIVVAVGADVEKEIDFCLDNVVENFCKTLGIKVVAKRSFSSKSELKGKYEQILDDKRVSAELEKMAGKLVAELEKIR